MIRGRVCCSRRGSARKRNGPRAQPCVLWRGAMGMRSSQRPSQRTAWLWRARGSTHARAAQLLGFKHHNRLISRINKRHTNLLHARSPVLPRKRSIIREPERERKQAEAEKKFAVTILHVEDDRYVADMMRDTLEAEGW